MTPPQLGDPGAFIEKAAQRAADAAAAGLAPLRDAGEGLARGADELVQAGGAALRSGEGAVRAAAEAGSAGLAWEELFGDFGQGRVEPHFGSKAAAATVARIVDWASGILGGE
jgi:hypothetical protein